MNDNYSIKINRQEGVVEISGGDKEWVSARLAELADIFKTDISVSKKSDAGAVSKSDTQITPAKVSRKRGVSSAGRAQKNPELAEKLTKEVRNKLEEYVRERQANYDKSLPAQAAIIATFLQDELGWEGVDHHDMYTVYSTMGWVAPGNPRAQLNNALQRNHYFGGVSDGKYLLSHTGENYARHHSKAVADQG